MAGRQKTGRKAKEPKGVVEPKKRPVKAPAKAPSKTEEGRAAVVKKLLKKLEAQMGGGEMKASLGDYIRLVQLHKELDEESPREIKVTWVEPAESTLVKDTEEKKSGGEE
jgi:hypothetical protein